MTASHALPHPRPPHLLAQKMHRPANEVRPDDWEEWLTTSNVEAARAMLRLFPAEGMAAEPVIE
ncbi:hypothetical protein [Burkholderia sp. 1B3(2022)]|uniref:hypothetical protein n=1 Tax=Burkholderia sp. 1B3(2022) TaxID=2997425 RepID=UPI003FA5838F